MSMIKAIGIISTNYRIDAIERLAQQRPVCAVPFGGRYRLLDFALSNLVNAGIRTVGVILPYTMRPLLDHLAAGKAWNLDRHSGGLYMLPSVTPALKPRPQLFCVKDFLANIEFATAEDADVVLVTASNYVVNMNFAPIIEQHMERGADITLVYKNGFKADKKVETKLVLDEDGAVTKILKSQDEETCHMDATFADVFVFNRELFIEMVMGCGNSEFKDLIDLVQAGLSAYRVEGYEFKGYMKQIFTVVDYHKTSMELLEPKIKRELFDGDDRIITKIKDSPPTRYENNADVKNSLVSNGCIIDGKVTHSLIFRNVTLKENCQVSGSILMQNCVVGENSILENVILDKGIHIPENSVLRAQKNSPMYLPKGTKV